MLSRPGVVLVSPSRSAARCRPSAVKSSVLNPLDCSVVVSPEGSAVTEDSGADHTHIGRNLGPGPLVLWVDYIEPAGTPLAVDMPDPGCG